MEYRRATGQISLHDACIISILVVNNVLSIKRVAITTVTEKKPKKIPENVFFFPRDNDKGGREF